MTKAVKICKLLIPQKESQSTCHNFPLLGIFVFEKNAKIVSNQAKLLAETLSRVFCSFTDRRVMWMRKGVQHMPKIKVSDITPSFQCGSKGIYPTNKVELQ